MRVDRGYLEAVLLASLLLLGGGYITAQSAANAEPAVDLSFLNGDWDFNGLEAFVRTAPKSEAKKQAKNEVRKEAKKNARN